MNVIGYTANTSQDLISMIQPGDLALYCFDERVVLIIAVIPCKACDDAEIHYACAFTGLDSRRISRKEMIKSSVFERIHGLSENDPETG